MNIHVQVYVCMTLKFSGKTVNLLECNMVELLLFESNVCDIKICSSCLSCSF